MEGSSFPLCLIVLVFCLTYVKLVLCSNDVEPKIVQEWADNIGAKINDFSVQVTGSTAVGKNLSKLPLKAKKNNGTKLVKDISEKMQHFFNKKIKSLRNVVVEAEQVRKNYKYDNDIEPFSYMDMKNYESSEYKLTFASAFKRNVTFNVSGVQVPTDIYNEDPEILNMIKWSQSLDKVFKNNLKEDPNLKWQFFGSETGVFRSYPAKEWELGPKNIDLYDARKRPWYVHGSSSPKTVVIMVDSSGSMYGRPMLIARLAVGELIDTLSENDYFNIMSFNKEVRYLGCPQTFVQATTQNKILYKNKLQDIKASYVAVWPRAFEAAFKLLKGSETDGANCQKVIMAFTDGTSERSPDVFKKYNGDKNVRVFTYAVGPPAHSIEALKGIACENKGYFYRIPGVGSVRDVIKGYVSVLSRPMAENNTHDPIWSSVYQDASGLGMMITGTLPIFHRPNQTGVATILGVTGTDVPLDDIDRLYNNSMLGADGFLFMINNNGHIMKHPFLKANMGYLEDPPAVYVSDIEFGWEEDSEKPLTLRREMLAKDVGTVSFDVAKFSSDERRVKKLSMNYFFTTIKDSPLRVGIASPKLGFDLIGGSDAVEVNDAIISFLTNYWKTQSISQNNVEAFVQTFTGTFKNSRLNSVFKPEEGIEGRIEDYPENITVLSVPHNSGKDNASNVTVTGYRSVRANASGETLYLAVVGFNVNNSHFRDDFFVGATTKANGLHSCNRNNSEEEEGYYCYLLDENAFVVGANAYSEVVTGQFFGKIDSEIMKHLVRGGNSSLSNPIYEKVEKLDYQGSCSNPSGGSSSSASFLQPLLSVTSYIKWCTTKTVWLILHLNVYNWFYGGPTYVSGESTEITKTKNRSCIMNITAYYANVTDTHAPQQGKTYCIGCQCQRSFVVSKVPKTNLFLLVVEASSGRCATIKTDPHSGIPGEPVESNKKQEESACVEDSYRRNIARCYTSNNPETNYPCGRCSLVNVSWIVFISTLCCVLYNQGLFINNKF